MMKKKHCRVKNYENKTNLYSFNDNIFMSDAFFKLGKIIGRHVFASLLRT